MKTVTVPGVRGGDELFETDFYEWTFSMPDDRVFDDPRPPTEEEWGTPLVEPTSAPDLEREFRRRIGMVSGAVPYVDPHPWLYRPFLFLSDPMLTTIDSDFAASISFIIARDNSCRFCYSTFRTLLRLSNFSPRDLQNLETTFSTQGFGEGEEWGLRLAVRLSRCEKVPSALKELRERTYSKRAIREIAGVSVLNLAANRIGTTLSIPVSAFEELGDRWYLGLWRTLVLPLLRLVRVGTNDVAPLASEGTAGPLAPWINTLRGTPVGEVIRDLTDAWLSTDRPFSEQTKLLMLAVVARGVAATELEAHLRARLRDVHDLSEESFATAVDHLGGPVVGERVEPLLRLARASIRYDFGPIKRIARNCTQHLGREATLEAIASASLANVLARLEFLFPLDEDQH